MLKNRFTLGAVAGLSAIALAIPILAQVSNAQSASTESTPSQQTQVSDPATGTDSTTTTAQISQSTAEQTALALHPGKLSDTTTLNSHFGGYKVEVTGNDGKEYDIIVDPTTGQITDSWIDGQGGPKGGAPHMHDKNDADTGVQASASSL